MPIKETETVCKYNQRQPYVRNVNAKITPPKIRLPCCNMNGTFLDNVHLNIMRGVSPTVTETFRLSRYRIKQVTLQVIPLFNDKNCSGYTLWIGIGAYHEDE